MLNTVE